MKTYVISTEYILSEFYAGLMAGIIQAIAGNCDARTVTGYMIKPEKDKDKTTTYSSLKLPKKTQTKS